MNKEFTTFDKCKAIRALILRRTSECIIYTSWSSEFKLKQIAEIPDVIAKWEKEEDVSFVIDPNELSYGEAKELGFSRWEEESDLMLIPLWLYPYLPDNIQTISIDGSTANSKAEIDTDHRFGCLAYGIRIKEVSSLTPFYKTKHE